MKTGTLYRRAAAAAFVLLWGISAGFAENTYINRANKWDIYLLGGTMSQQQIDYRTKSGFAPISMSQTFMGGFGFGYHFNEAFDLRFEGSGGYPTFNGHGPAAGVNRSASLHQGLIALDWNILRKRITPYLNAGFGWQYLYVQTSSIGTPVAYWDPWWGYTVGTTYPSYTETDFLTNAGLGIRAELSEHLFLKLSADVNWLKYTNANSSVNQVRYGLVIGGTY